MTLNPRTPTSCRDCQPVAEERAPLTARIVETPFFAAVGRSEAARVGAAFG
jgi:hypothetical protein